MPRRCKKCGAEVKNEFLNICNSCFYSGVEAAQLASGNPIFNKPDLQEDVPQYNEPEHYHKHNIDTILFLQEGFPPEVFMGFAIGHIVKYAQRADYKNGREDYVKMVDYAKRALDWYDKTKNLGE